MKKLPIALAVIVLTRISLCQADAQGFRSLEKKQNYSARRAIIINNAGKFLRLSKFSFKNTYFQEGLKLMSKLTWKNTGKTSITAFEVVELLFDPFNRPMNIGGQWVNPGHNSGNWMPLKPGQTSSDASVEYQEADAFTGIVYVRAIRFVDGTVWYSNQSNIAKRVEHAMPALRKLPNLEPKSTKPTGER